jgi:hypothetical protein
MIRHLAFAATAIAAVAAPLAAQRPSPAAATAPAKVAHVTPYVGYMKFGSYLTGPLGTSVRNADGLLYGAQLGLKMSPNVAVVGNVAYSSSNLEVGLPVLGGISVGESSVLFYDANVELGMAIGAGTARTSITPFVQLGAGGLTAKLTNSVVDVDATSFAANGGVGADISFGPSLGLRVMAKDYFGKFDFKEVAGFDLNNDWTHNVALSAGLRLSF